MTTFDWTTAIAECSTHLAGLGKLPPPEIQSSALRALAVLSLTAEAGIAHVLTPASTVPTLSILRYAGGDDLAAELLDELTRAVAAPSRGFFHQALSPTNWLTAHGLVELVLRSVRHTGDDTGRAALLAHAARKVKDLMQEQRRLQQYHMTLLLDRDAPRLVSDWHNLPDTLPWILAHEYDGDPTRAIRVERRLQALTLYASLADRLREPPITEVIDSGGELVPALTDRLALSRPQLAALREAAPPTASGCTRRHNFEHAVRRLQAHAVPLHQWPGGGRPCQHSAWQSSPWLTIDDLAPVRADYFGDDADTVRDAVRGFNDDLLVPLLADWPLKIAPASNLRLFVALGGVLNSAHPGSEQLAAVQQSLACVRRALVGDRGPKAFREAARVWHRRAAAVAALRNENQCDRPGWPPLCPPWTSRCGNFEIMPLTTAKALVEEGNAHQHCVGTYYEACRCGGTQILSLRAAGKPAVTAEILLDERVASLRVGQFKGLHDKVPDDPALHQIMRDFLRDLRGGLHPLNREALRAYRKWANEHVYAWRERPLSIAHAREAYPLYRALLPRGAPADFDRWCDSTGIRKGLRLALNVLKRHADDHAGGRA